MTLYRHPKETQLDFVRRMLHERGSISTGEALDELAYPDGEKTRIVRLAGRVCELRAEGIVLNTVELSSGNTRYELLLTPYQPKLIDGAVRWAVPA